MKEYDRFEKGAANSNTSTAVLQRQMGDPDVHIIITTIQKLDIFVRKNKGHPAFKQHFVIIFDECHRSQFGDMHQAITKAFKNYHLFGFTGTPIFAVNAGSGGDPNMRTTPQAFGDKLHTYTIVDAINDGNVLPFRIDYINTVKEKADIKDAQVRAIDIEKAIGAPKRIEEIVRYTLEHFDQKTKRNSFYTLKGQRTAGFNSIFAVSSIPMAMKYYTEFKRQLAEQQRELTVATIFSFAENEADPEDVMPEEGFDTEALDKTSRDFLDGAKEILGAIDRAIDSSIQLRSKKDLIQGFIETVNASTVVDRDWRIYVEKQKEQDLDQIIAEEKLKPDEAKHFIDNSFRDGTLKTTGTDFDRIMPPVSRFGGGSRTEKKQGIIRRLSGFFEKYLGVA